MIRKDNILSKQNSILKVFTSLILVLISTIISSETFLIIFTFTILYMIVSPIIYFYWLKIIVKVIPFFISLFIFGILFQVPFPDQCLLSIRITHLLLISVYLAKTSSIVSFLTRKKNQDSRFWFKCKFFIAATIHFIPILTVKFNNNINKTKNIIDIIVLSMEDSVNEIHNVEKAISNKLRIDNEVREVSVWSDIYLSLLVIFPCFLIFISFR